MAQVDRAEAVAPVSTVVALVPVEREGAQGALEVGGDDEQIGYARLARRARRAGRVAGAFQGAHGGFGAQGPH